ncbi:MAG TPA: hypothetical protein PK706_27530, partial [Xanthobacteraceae bacterium]|nr:hypothetical protein [Xanthobacteraceae bacterium]
MGARHHSPAQRGYATPAQRRAFNHSGGIGRRAGALTFVLARVSAPSVQAASSSKDCPGRTRVKATGSVVM